MAKSLLKEFHETKTGRERLDEFDYERVSVVCERIPIADRTGYGRQYESELSATIRVKFWSNNAQYEHARRAATETLLRFIYGDVLNELPELRSAIFDGDRRRALEIVSRMEEIMKRPL